MHNENGGGGVTRAFLGMALMQELEKFDPERREQQAVREKTHSICSPPKTLPHPTDDQIWETGGAGVSGGHVRR